MAATDRRRRHTSECRAKLLLLTESAFYPPYQGDSARLLSLIQYFRGRGWRVAIVHFHDRSQHDANYAAMAELCDGLHVFYPDDAELRTRNHDRIDDWCPPRFVAYVADVAAAIRPDVVIVQFVFFSRCLEGLPPGHDPLKVIDVDNLFTQRRELYLAHGLNYNWFSTNQEQERNGYARADILLAIQEHELEQIMQIAPSKPVLLVPHTQHVRYLPPPTGQSLLFVGAANPENAQGLRRFIGEALPMIRRHVPSVSLSVVGRVCDTIDGAVDGVRLHGVVDSLSDAYGSAAIVLNPVECGTGLKIKTVEAICHGRCLVTTPAGAQGLEGFKGIYHVARDATDFATVIVNLFREPSRIVETGRQALRFAASYFNPERVLGRLEHELLKRVESRARRQIGVTPPRCYPETAPWPRR